MSEADLHFLTQRVLWIAAGLGAALGVVANRSHFCTMGALADWVNMGDTTRLRAWVVAIAVAVLGFNTMVALGWVKAGDSVYAPSTLTWLSFAVGGMLFGGGMVLASGCGNKTLVRLGGGNLKSLVVLLVMGLSAWMTMRGVTALLRTATVEKVTLQLPAGQDLPSLLQAWGARVELPALAGLAGALAAVALLAWVLAHRDGRRAEVWVSGLPIGLIVVALWWTTGVLGHVAEHPTTLEEAFLATSSRRMESFSSVAPAAYMLEYLVFASDASRTLTVGVVASLGVVLGSGLFAVITRQFRWEGFANVDDMARHLVGAVLMGVGGVTALGCTFGQGLSGLSTLSLGSVIATLSIAAGAWMALRWQIWRLEQSV